MYMYVYRPRALDNNYTIDRNHDYIYLLTSSELCMKYPFYRNVRCGTTFSTYLFLVCMKYIHYAQQPILPEIHNMY